MKKAIVQISTTSSDHSSTKGMIFPLSPTGSHVVDISGTHIAVDFKPSFRSAPGEQTIDGLCDELKHYIEYGRNLGYEITAEVVVTENGVPRFPKLLLR